MIRFMFDKILNSRFMSLIYLALPVFLLFLTFLNIKISFFVVSVLFIATYLSFFKILDLKKI